MRMKQEMKQEESVDANGWDELHKEVLNLKREVKEEMEKDPNNGWEKLHQQTLKLKQEVEMKKEQEMKQHALKQEVKPEMKTEQEHDDQRALKHLHGARVYTRSGKVAKVFDMHTGVWKHIV